MTAAGARVAVIADTATGVRYAQHTVEGLEPATASTARWAVEWTAPEAGGDVVFHVAANAADFDASPLGDRIYMASARAQPASARSTWAANAAGSERRTTTSGVPCQAATSRSARATSRASAPDGRTPCSR